MSVLDATALDTDPAGLAYLAATLRSGSPAKMCPQAASFSSTVPAGTSRSAAGTAAPHRRSPARRPLPARVD